VSALETLLTSEGRQHNYYYIYSPGGTLSVISGHNFVTLDQIIDKSNQLRIKSILRFVLKCQLDWLIEQGLTSHQTHYRSHRGRFLQAI